MLIDRRTRATRSTLLGIVLCALFPFINGCAGSGVGAIGAIPAFNLYWSVAVGDFNGDGKPDIAASYTYFASATSRSGFVAVFLQDPAKPGNFLSPSRYSVGEQRFGNSINCP
jgi:hypothetical protein